MSGRDSAGENSSAGGGAARLKRLFSRRATRDDAMAGLVLGIESVPDGLASGLLAGLNPVAGLYAYLYGMLGAAFFTSTAFMAVQGTGAMAIIVADVDAVHSGDDPVKALVTLSLLTGIVMAVAGALKLGSMLRFVPNSVMTGFISAVGINIVLGQLGDFTGYVSDGPNRVARAFDTLFHFWEIDLWTFTVGVVTIAFIITLRKTKLGALGLVVAVGIGSGVAAVISALGAEIQLVGNIAEVPASLPFITLPSLGDIPTLIVPAIALAFVGLVQGAGVTANFPNPDGSPSDVSQDFIGQGAGNIASGFFQGMPVGGSMSASSLIVSAGAKTRTGLMFASGVMAIVVLVFSGVVEYIAMPSLAGLLIVVGVETVKPDDILSVWKTGRIQATVMSVTLVLTLLIPLQYAVLVGIGIAMILYIFRQSNQIVARRLEFDGDRIHETDPPAEVPPGEIVIIQPYGSLFFAAAPVFEAELPTVTEDSENAVVIIRLKGKSDVGSTLLDVLAGYAQSLQEVNGKLMIVTDSDTVREQLIITGAANVIGAENIYASTEWLTEAVRHAERDAEEWIAERRSDDETTRDES